MWHPVPGIHTPPGSAACLASSYTPYCCHGCPDADFQTLLAALSGPELANVRQYIDTTMLVLLRRRPDLLRSRVLPLLLDCTSSSSHALSSLLLVAARDLVRRLQPVAESPAATTAPAAAAAGTQAGAAWVSAAGEASQLARDTQLEDHDSELLGEVVRAISPWTLSHVHALR